jgi:predicted O-methyltransferase YrrM
MSDVGRRRHMDHSLRLLTRRIATSRVAYIGALPTRVSLVARHDSKLLRQSVRWLVRSREHTNLTYDLTPFNREHLAWFIADIACKPIETIRRYMAELEQDVQLSSHVATLTKGSRRRRLADTVPRFGRRLGWYALIRSLRPLHVVETGTDKGLGACVLASALLRNGCGRLTSIDVNPEAGYLIEGRYAGVVDLRIGDSVATLSRLPTPIDIFLHTVHHSGEQERDEYNTIESLLTPHAVVLSDNAKMTNELAKWAVPLGYRLSCFYEAPADHWYPGMGICAAVPGNPQTR